MNGTVADIVRVPEWSKRMLTKGELSGILGVCTKTLDRGIDEKTFPQPIYLKKRQPRWRGWEVLDWLERRTDRAK